MEFKSCPVCSCPSTTKPRSDLETHPYVECLYCGLYYQLNPPKKVYEADHETSGDLMSENDKYANRALAEKLYKNHLIKNVKKKLYFHIDIGSKYPYLGHCLQKMGKVHSYGIDGIKEAKRFGKELGVEMTVADFEENDVKYNMQGADLITLVHCIEHFYKPVETFKKIRKLASNNAIVFIRCPDSNTPGVERDFTKSHYDIHPLVWNEQAMYELLYQLRDKFEVYETYELQPGQRDYLLKTIKHKPIIAVGYITKNEEKDLPNSLESIKGVVDRLCLRDTGSSDSTIEIASDFCRNNKLICSIENYLRASEKDESGDYKLWNFAKARNEFVKWIDRNADWCLWMDADDIASEEAVKIMKRIPYMQYDLHGFVIRSGANGHLHHRLWRTNKGIKFVGAVHEYPGWPADLQYREWDKEFYITHIHGSGHGESSIFRNLRILEREIKTDKSHRNFFYLANTYRDASGIPKNTDEEKKNYLNRAIECYNKYIEKPIVYWDEYVFCHWYKARCYRFLDNYEECLNSIRKGISIDPTLAEFYMEACYLESSKMNYWQAISWALLASKCKFSQRLFTEYNKYTDQPLRQLTHCFNNLGEREMALKWGRKVKKYVNDASWEKFLREIDKTKVINICRPGAMGDVLATGWVLRGLKIKYPDSKIHYYTKHSDVANLLQNVHNVYDNDDWNARKTGIDLVLTGYPIKEGYPEVAMKKHLVNYFAIEAGVEPKKPSIIKLLHNYSMGGPYVTVHCCAGWSKYKNWPVAYWNELILMLKAKYGVKVVQLGGPEDEEIENADRDLRAGATVIWSLSVLNNAKLHLGVDSFLNHASVLVNTPAVILFGSTSPIGSGYKENKNVWLNLKCSPCYREDPKISQQSRGVCIIPKDQTYDNPAHLCMYAMKPSHVFNEVMQYVEDQNISFKD